jgi:hypothetical protein
MPGPETITIQKELKRDTSFLKFDDNQNKKWNSDVPDIVANLSPGMTIDVWYELRPVTFTDDTGQEKTVQSKYIMRAIPSKSPPQELRAPYQGSSGGGGGHRGGGGQKKGDGDFRTSGELIVLDCLAAAVKLHEGILRDRVTAGDAVDAAARTLRASITQTADVFCEYVRAEGAKLGKSSEAAAAAPPSGDGRNPNGTYSNPPSGWGEGNTPTEAIGFGDPDSDIPL